MKPPAFDFPSDAITHLIAPPEMVNFGNLRAIAVPSITPGVHFVGIINDAAKHWRFVRGPVAVHSPRIWRWLARVDAHWLNASWAIQANGNFIANSPDDVLDRFAKTGTAKGHFNP